MRESKLTCSSLSGIWLMIILPPLLVALGVILGSVDFESLAGSGHDLLGSKVWVLPR